MYENDTYNFLNMMFSVFLAIGTAVAQPAALGGQKNVGKKNESQSGTITFGL